jgi:glycosyltransferase involved in cell wall biosynthesis
LNNPQQPKVLVLLGTAYFPPFIDQIGELSELGKYPRPWLLDLPGDLTLLDQRFLTGPPRWLLALYRIIPIWAAQALEAFRVKRDYDVVFAWGAEPVALSFALLLLMARQRVPLVLHFTWVSPRKKSLFIRLVQSRITKLITPPPTQYEFAINVMRLPKDKVIRIPQGVDEQFWQSPNDARQDMICSAGREMRDYETLLQALDGTGIRCDIAAPLIRGKGDHWRRLLGDSGEKARLPDNVTFGQKGRLELRDLYARSRFVVLPLYNSDTDNGITCLLEAWSMSRPVICSKTDGEPAAVDPGRNGLFVPVGDVAALREAIVSLWAQPEEAARMGAEGRQDVEKHRRLARYAREIGEVIVAAAGTAQRGSR